MTTYDARTVKRRGETMKPIQATFCGIQQGPHPFELWTLLEPMGCECHTILSTVSRQTINAHGFEPIPEKGAKKP